MYQRLNLIKLGEQVDFLTVLLSEPNDFLKSVIEEDSLVPVLNEVFEDYNFDSFFGRVSSDDAFLKIKRDWLYLYVGVSGPLASPYASSYYRSTHRLMDKPAKDILALNKKWGIETEESYKDMPDHLSAILQTVSILIEVIQYDEREQIKEEAYKDLSKLSVATLKWIPEMKKRTIEHESIEFYSVVLDNIIKVLEQFKEIEN